MRTSARPDPVRISAHRCGVGKHPGRQNSWDGLRHALSLDAEYVEFDVRRLADDTLVVLHDADVDGRPVNRMTFDALAARRPDIARYEDFLAAIAGHKRAHIDLKFSSYRRADHPDREPAAVRAVATAVELLGAENVLATLGDDRAVRAVRDWADERGLQVLVGLSLGRGVTGLSLRRQVMVRASELWPHLRYHRSRANVVVAHHWLALLGVARFARRRRLPLLVWTVDGERALRHWLRPGRAWLVTTNHPVLAVRLRDATLRA